MTIELHSTSITPDFTNLNSEDLERQKWQNNIIFGDCLEVLQSMPSNIVGIKSGINWGNADQINAMKNNFKLAKETLRKKGVNQDIIAVNGCMYGKDRNPLKDKTKTKVIKDIDKVYYKYAGQDFWKFISGDDNLYQKIIVPIDQKAQEKDEAFKKAYNAKVNEMNQEFILNFMNNNQIDWVKLIDYVSKREV